MLQATIFLSNKLIHMTDVKWMGHDTVFNDRQQSPWFTIFDIDLVYRPVPEVH